MSYPRPADTSALEGFYRCPIAYDQRHCELTFDRAVLDLPVRQPDAQLARLMSEFAERQLAALGPTVASDPFLDRLRATILARLTSRLGPMLPETARELALSPRTLQRRLREQNSSFQGVVNEVRLGLAAAYLAKEELALGEIAFVLGYSEPSAFHRAFKRAFACTPAEYRGRHRAARR
jgi:AraC-like DNA-binding protein